MKIRIGTVVVLMMLFSAVAQSSVTLIMGQHFAQSGTQIQVPVKVKDFNNIISVQGTIEFHPQILHFVNVQSFSLPGMNASSFGTSQTQNGKLMFSWFENNLTGQFLPDSAVLFTIVFQVTGSIGQQSMLNFVNAPTSLEVINASFQQQQLTLFNGFVEIQQTPMVYDMAIFCDTMTVIPGSSILVPVRAVDFNEIVSVQGTIAFDPSIVSLSSITSFGLPGMNSANFGYTQTQNGLLTYSWNDLSNQGVSLSDSSVLFMINFFVTGTFGQSSAVEFTGLPVTLEVADTSLQPLTVLYNNGLVQIQQNVQWSDPVFMLDTVSGPHGAQVTAYARAVNFDQIVSFQGTIHFDENIASFVTVENFGLPGMSINDFGLSLTTQGKLMFSWTDPLLIGVNLPDTASLFSITFLINGVQGEESPLGFSSAPTPLECTDTSFAPIVCSFTNGRILVEGDAQIFLNDPAATVYCTGDSIHVSYTTSGSYVSGNMFILTLSDAVGNFSSPWFLDTLYTILDSTFHTSIPLGIPSGSGYRLRIISTNPVSVSNITSSDITIFSTQTAPSTPIGPVDLCQNPVNSTYTIPAVPGATSYTWTLTPSGTGSITPSGTSATIDWNNTYTGTASITVSASIGSCQGAASAPLVVTITPTPGTPSTPTGPLDLCQNPVNSTYTIPAASGTTSYTWTLTPSGAGSITPSGTSATIDWNNTYTGPASITVSASAGSCQGAVSAPLVVTITATPGTPSTPTGPVDLCENPLNSTYTIPAVSGATSYTWTLTPSGAGSITPSGTSATVDWNNTYTGIASISISASTGSCQGAVSAPLVVTITSTPGTPSTPAGPIDLCENPLNSTYTIPAVPGATSYTWTLTPSGTGSITPSGTSATVDWNNTYTGTAAISVSASTGSCQGAESAPLVVTITSTPGTPSTPTGPVDLCQNPVNSTYTIPPVSGATSYTWTLTPLSAGSIIPSGTSVTVDWNDIYTGTATLEVAAFNGNCQGPLSSGLLITIGEYPGTPLQPVGDTIICEGTISTVYSTSEPMSASFSWVIVPSGAGTISLSGVQATITWNPLFTGSAGIVVQGVNSCGQGLFSDTLFVELVPLPVPPDITFNGTMLSSDYPTGNQWYLDGNHIPGANGQTHIVTQNGAYFSLYTDANGCMSVSDTIYVTTVRLENVSPIDHEVFPNPGNGLFVIRVNTAPCYILHVSDMTGRIVFTGRYCQQETTIDLRKNSSGIYVFRVITDDTVFERKVILRSDTK